MIPAQFHYVDHQLHCESRSLADICRQVGTPLYVYSRSQLRERARSLLQAMTEASAGRALSTRAHFSVKANGNSALLAEIADLGLGADVTSGGELFLALEAGFHPSQIVFSGAGKRPDELEMAVAASIGAIHVESGMELAWLGDIAERLDRPVRVAIRLNPGIAAATHSKLKTGAAKSKFGVSLPAAKDMAVAARDHPSMTPVGLSLHIGSQIVELEPFTRAAEVLLAAAGAMQELSWRPDYLDVGGGLGIAYDDNQEAPPTLAAWVQATAGPILAAGFDAALAPGRSIVGPAGALLTRVLYVKETRNRRLVIVDAGMNDLLRPTLYGARHPIWPVTQPDAQSASENVDVVGPLCEAGDWLARDIALPPVTPGDVLAIMQAGAYGYAMSSNYNGRPRPAEVLVNGHDLRFIRRRESYRDLLAEPSLAGKPGHSAS